MTSGDDAWGRKQMDYSMNVDMQHHTTGVQYPALHHRYHPRSRQEKVLHFLCGLHARGSLITISGRELARRACESTSAADMTAILDQLEAGGWIAVETLPRTRRIVVLRNLPEQQSFIDHDCSASIMIDHDRSGTVTCIEERAHAHTCSLSSDLEEGEEEEAGDDSFVASAAASEQATEATDRDPRIAQLCAAGVKTRTLAAEIVRAQAANGDWTIGTFLADLTMAQTIDGLERPLGYVITLWRNGDRMFPAYTAHPTRDAARVPQFGADGSAPPPHPRRAASARRNPNAGQLPAIIVSYEDEQRECRRRDALAAQHGMTPDQNDQLWIAIDQGMDDAQAVAFALAGGAA